MTLGSAAIHHIAILVKDLDKAMTKWEELLGLEKVMPCYLPLADQVPQYTNGEMGEYADCRMAVYDLANIRLELVEPGEKAGPWRDYMEKHGEGCQHLSFVVPDRRAASEALRAIGVSPAYHIGYYPDSTYSFYDSTAQLGVEVNIKTNEDNTGKILELREDASLHQLDL